MSKRRIQEPNNEAPRRRGCGPLTVLFTLLIVLGGGSGAVLLMLSGQPNSIRMKVEPARAVVTAGQSFTVTVTIENVDLNAVTINSIGLEKNLIGGVEVVQMDPQYRTARERNVPLVGKWTDFKLDQQIPGGDTLVITFTLMAQNPGTYSGEVTVWVQGTLLGIPFERARRATLSVQAS